MFCIMFEPNGGRFEAPQGPYLHAISQFMQNTDFFSFLPNALLPLLSCYNPIKTSFLGVVIDPVPFLFSLHTL